MTVPITNPPSSSPRVSRRLRWLAVVVVTAGILVASVVRPAASGPTLGPLGVVGLDKYLHAIAFGTLAATLAVALAGDAVEQQLVLAVAVAVGYGLAIELTQLPLSYRSFSLLDLVADAVGALLAALAWRAGRRLRRIGR